MWIRHGDVIIEKVESFDQDVKLNKVKSAVLAEGKVTGHFHRLTSECMFADLGTQKLVELIKPTELVHEEHDTLLLPIGKYKVLVQREVDLLGEVHQVMD